MVHLVVFQLFHFGIKLHLLIFEFSSFDLQGLLECHDIQRLPRKVEVIYCILPAFKNNKDVAWEWLICYHYRKQRRSSIVRSFSLWNNWCVKQELNVHTNLLIVLYNRLASTRWCHWHMLLEEFEPTVDQIKWERNVVAYAVSY